MSQENENKTTRKADIPNLSELFGDAAKLDVTAGDLFGGDLSAVRSDPRPRPYASTPGQAGGQKSFNLTQFVLIVNMVVLTGILVYLVRRPAEVVSVPAAVSAQTDTPTSAEAQPPAPQDNTDPAAQVDTMDLGRHTTEVLDGAISLQTAEAFYTGREYRKAAYVYERLRRKLTLRTFEDEVLADWLTLRMALCLQHVQEQGVKMDLFSRALNSRSPAVRALTHYHLAFIQIHNRSFLEARQQAYQTLALLRTIETQVPLTVEADCYFLAAESLTRYLLRMSNLGEDPPGIMWSDMQPVHSLSFNDQNHLAVLLTEGTETLAKAVIAPTVNFDPSRSVGAQWSAYAFDGPLDQLMQQFASEADINLSLNGLDAVSRRHKTNLLMQQVDRNYLAEVAAGSAGLVWRFDGQTGGLVDPVAFEDTDSLKASLVQEAIAMWQRFLLRYRGDHRMPNVHYCLGQLYTIAEQTATALGEYKLLATQFANNPLAPYGLLGSSRLKTDLRDYEGAQTDLNELLIRYPNAKIMDEALLYLAEATMLNGGCDEAAEMFERVFYLNVSPEARRASSFGLGKCAFEQGRFEDVIKWMKQCLALISDKDDKRILPVRYMLGKAYVQCGQFVQAAQSLRTALGGRMADHEYVQIILELVEAEVLQEHYLAAMNILESIPEARLSQEDSVAVMLAKSRLYRQIDVPTTAISLLRRKIQFIAESRLRAQLSLELAECYLQNGELTPARNELNDALASLPSGYDTQRAAFLLARIAYLNQKHERAKSLCIEALGLNIQDKELRGRVYDLLGTIYTEEKAFDQAALAYAGVLGKTEMP